MFLDETVPPEIEAPTGGGSRHVGRHTAVQTAKEALSVADLAERLDRATNERSFFRMLGSIDCNRACSLIRWTGTGIGYYSTLETDLDDIERVKNGGGDQTSPEACECLVLCDAG